jgi:hypothetical protein
VQPRRLRSPNQHTIDNTEKRRVRTYPECQGEERHDGEARVLEQLTEAEFEVVHFRIYDLRLTILGNTKHQTPSSKNQRNPKP